MSKVAKLVAKVIKDIPEIRGFIKSEALLMFDGDYDVLIKDPETWISFPNYGVQILISEYN